MGWGVRVGVGGYGGAIPPFPSPLSIPLLPGSPHKIRSPPLAPSPAVPSNLRHGGTGLPGFPRSPPGRTPPGASPSSHRLHRRSAGNPPAPAAAQPSARPLPAGQGGAPVLGGHQPGPHRRGRPWEALLPARGCRYRERAAGGGGGVPGPPASSCTLLLLLPPLNPRPGARSCRCPRCPPGPPAPIADALRRGGPVGAESARASPDGSWQRSGRRSRGSGGRDRVATEIEVSAIAPETGRGERPGPAAATAGTGPGGEAAAPDGDGAHFPGPEKRPRPPEEAGKARPAAASRARAPPGSTGGSNRRSGRSGGPGELRAGAAPAAPGPLGRAAGLAALPVARGTAPGLQHSRFPPWAARAPGFRARRPAGRSSGAAGGSAPLSTLGAGADASPGLSPSLPPAEQHPPLTSQLSSRAAPGPSPTLRGSPVPRAFYLPSFAFISEAKGSALTVMGTRWGPAKPPHSQLVGGQVEKAPGGSRDTRLVPSTVLTCPSTALGDAGVPPLVAGVSPRVPFRVPIPSLMSHRSFPFPSLLTQELCSCSPAAAAKFFRGCQLGGGKKSSLSSLFPILFVPPATPCLFSDAPGSFLPSLVFGPFIYPAPAPNPRVARKRKRGKNPNPTNLSARFVQWEFYILVIFSNFWSPLSFSPRWGLVFIIKTPRPGG